MKQGNGSDLLSANDPRNATIGMIYVAPADDRESVLAAILTQEKLGRKQIAIVLPNQNKAFQRPVDFDGLKNMRKKLQAQLVVVAPQGSGPADFARQRQFTYYSSLENYAQSLRDEGEAAKATKRGIWPFSGRNAKQAAKVGVVGAAGDVEAPTPANASNEVGLTPTNDHEDKEDDQHAPGKGAALGVGLGVAGLAAGAAMHAADSEDQSSVENGGGLDDDAAFALPAPPVPLTPTASSPSLSEDSSQELEADEATPSPSPARQGADGSAVSPGIITFTVPARSRNTKQLAPIDADTPDEEPDDAAGPATWRQRSGKTAAVVGGAAIVAAGAGAAGNAPPPGTFVGQGSGGPTAPLPRPQRWNGRQLLLLALAGLLLLSLLLCGGIALAAPATWNSFTSSFTHVLPGAGPTATVTITPKSVTLQNTYGITGVTSGTPDSAKREVQARQLKFTTPSQTKTVSATGFVNTPGIHATGTLTFFNGLQVPYGVTAGTVFTDAQGVQIANNILAYIPAGNPNTGFGRVTVPAHAVTTGTAGNIRAFDFNNVICCGNQAISVSNTVAFSGGQNPQKFVAVQQSDIDRAAAPFKQPLLESALAAINGMKRANEQFVGTPKCVANVTSNHQAGDQATSVTVSVTATCTGEVYDLVGAENIATNLLKGEAAQYTSIGYALKGVVVTSVTQALVDNKGTVRLFVKAGGVWVYQFSDAQKAQLAGLIAGKTPDEATSLLLQQQGVSKVVGISISSGNTLPTDATQITIVVQNVPGFQATPTATAGTGTSTPTSTLTSPVAQPSPGVTPGK